ncbi:hypothetical protein MFLAVUS_002563 [Mucor flavus]|uniref:Pyruvate decarboxylase n=1 Tax=Mucor flavus TaxID=439312 RepID=A0ABP9YQL9_9FUNG
MPLLDLIEDDTDLHWGNNKNELNAAYAADGYARVRRAGAVVTTFGVGELSTINGIAGPYPELLPVIHIVGPPRTTSQNSGTLLHHTLGNGDFDSFRKMSITVTVASASLSFSNAILEIDRVFQTAITKKRPGYIEIPIDLQVRASNNPAIIVDGRISRYHLESKVNELVKASGFSTFSAPIGKGIIDESLSNYRGVYVGNVTLDGVAKEIENADLLIEIGSIKSDPTPIDNSTTELTHNYLWNKLPEFIKPNSIIALETGTAAFGAFNTKSPKGATFISQLFWGSIGYSVGVAVGAAMADRGRKVYLFVGDGSFQLTVQEISVFIRQGLTPVIFLLNNDGYLMEKLIHGPERSYNNFQMWKYSQTLDYFGGNLEVNKTEGKKPTPIGVGEKVSTRQEFEIAMEKIDKEPNKIHFLEVVMPEFDSPRELSLMVTALNLTNSMPSNQR